MYQGQKLKRLHSRRLPSGCVPVDTRPGGEPGPARDHGLVGPPVPRLPLRVRQGQDDDRRRPGHEERLAGLQDGQAILRHAQGENR